MVVSLVGVPAAPQRTENRERRTERAGAKRQTFHGYRAPLRGDGPLSVRLIQQVASAGGADWLIEVAGTLSVARQGAPISQSANQPISWSA